jgi:hypothetical protein
MMGFGLSDFFAAWSVLGDATWRLLWYGDSLDILEDTPERLVVKSARGRFTFDRLRRAVLRKHRILTAFDEIESIDLETVPIDTHRCCWSLSLNRERGSSIYVGRTIDDAQASIVAAHIATVTGKPVVAIK